MNKKLAIIGAATGQLPLCIQAKKMQVETFCFAWPKDAICKDFVDHFIPISIMEMDKIVDYCRENEIDGIVSNASETTAAVVSYVSSQLDKIGTPYETFKLIQNKAYVRNMTNKLIGLSAVNFKVGNLEDIISTFPRPFVMKPVKGAAKIGVNYIDESIQDIEIPTSLKGMLFMAEEFIEGKEFSVESMSYRGRHQVIQITEKISSGPPHFVELEHHQPAVLKNEAKDKILILIPKILTAVGYTDGASHIEIKVDERDNVYLIEVNPRGGGDEISNTLIGLSTDYNFPEQLIRVSLDEYEFPKIHNVACSGIYYLTSYSSRLIQYFNNKPEIWEVNRERTTPELTVASSNYDRDGYIVYKSSQKIVL